MISYFILLYFDLFILFLQTTSEDKTHWLFLSM